MSLPEPRALSLPEAAQLVADRCSVSIEVAKNALDRAFREHGLVVFDARGRNIVDWQYLEINWECSSITYRGPSVLYTIEGANVFREHIDAWMAHAEFVAPRKGRRRRGPAPGTLDRYGAPDREMYTELESLMRDEMLSVSAAALRLAEDGKLVS
jgi:hypothetical protein